MKITESRIENLEEILSIIHNAIIDMESENIYQWDDIYPDRRTVISDINNQSLYVYFDEFVIKGIIAFDERQEKEYETINWRYGTGRQLIIHRLCVDPKYKKQGIARSLVAFAEQFGKMNGFESIRLDSFVDNIRACKLYLMGGYDAIGIVNFRKGKFICFEKKL